jgi:hypothetical protein
VPEHEPPEVDELTTVGESPAEAEEEDDGTFAFFSIEGDDFVGRGMPAYAAREVTAFSDAMVEIAKDLWKQQNPDSKRAPNGFERAFGLRLTEVLPGSARPQMILERPSTGVTDEEWAEWEPIFRQARDIATVELARVASDDAVPVEMRPKVRKALGKIGGTLDGNDRIRLGPPGASAPRATVTPRVHKVLKMVDETLLLERATEVVGVLTEYNGVTKSFDLRNDDGHIVKCIIDDFDPELAERARIHLAVDGVTAPDVRVEGQTRDDEGRVRRIYNVHTLEVVWTVAEKLVVHRLRSLPKLGAGWLGPGSDAPTADLVGRLEPLASDISALGIPVGIVANSGGSIVLEWRRGDVEFTAEAQVDGNLFMCADHVVTDALDETEIDFDIEVLRRFLISGAMQ